MSEYKEGYDTGYSLGYEGVPEDEAFPCTYPGWDYRVGYSEGYDDGKEARKNERER